MRGLFPKYIFIALGMFLFSGVHVAFSQQREIDSLRTLIKNEKIDSLKIFHIGQLADTYGSNNLDSAIQISQRVLVLAKKTKSQFNIAKAYTDLGWYNYLKGNPLPAVEYSQSALNILDTIQNEKVVFDTIIYQAKGAALGNLAIMFRDQGNNPRALEYHLKALKINEQLKHPNETARTLGNIGLIYADQKDYKKALDYYFKALKLDEENKNMMGLSFRYNNIGIVYYEMKNYPKALIFYMKGLKISEQLADKRKIARSLGNIGNVYAIEEQYSIAFDYFEKALKLNEEIKSKNGITIQLGNIGSTLLEQKKYSEAETYLLRAMVIDTEIGYLKHAEDTYKNLKRLYFEKKDFKKAFEYYQKYITARDSLFNSEKNNQITRQGMNYEFEKKEAEAKAEQDKKDALISEEKQKQSIIIYSISGGLILVLILAGVIFRSLRNNKKKNAIILHQKDLVEEKQKEILDSIRYAKRIQSALLPSEKYIHKSLNRLKNNIN